MCKLYFGVVGIVCNDKVLLEILSKFSLVLIISFFGRMSHAESVKFIFKMTHLRNVPS